MKKVVESIIINQEVCGQLEIWQGTRNVFQLSQKVSINAYPTIIVESIERRSIPDLINTFFSFSSKSDWSEEQLNELRNFLK